MESPVTIIEPRQYWNTGTAFAAACDSMVLPDYATDKELVPAIYELAVSFDLF
jgi:hypothetical protein